MESGRDPAAPVLAALVRELLAKDSDFRMSWAGHPGRPAVRRRDAPRFPSEETLRFLPQWSAEPAER
ncbi:hypothetical protein [Amycolatopsis lexingtonensis]|uniref:hypothetical protein n=1 Tax=Amycolatopsis lexingtonensis TaxID=218822 RepID=UPI003F704417